MRKATFKPGVAFTAGNDGYFNDSSALGLNFARL